jgi:3-oxoacyl-[acyl-carrier-protein] synthase I
MNKSISSGAPVLSALGICCALGTSKQQVWQAAIAGSRAGMVWRDDLLLAGQPVVVGAVTESLPDFAPAFAAVYSRNNHLAYCAWLQIQAEVASARALYGADRIAVVIGSSTSGIAEGEQALELRLQQGEWPAGYDYQKQEMVAPANFIAQLSKVTGPAYVISTACSSSARALISARNLLRAGLADAVIVGGVDSLCRMTLQGFAALESIAAGYCQPFGAARDGINIGEGAALFLMEREPDVVDPSAIETARNPLIRLAGVGAAADAYHMSAPHPEGRGAETAIRQALTEAGLAASELGYINLHGTATPLNDAMESTVLERLGAAAVPASSSKSITGHTLGAAGAIEAGLCWLLLSDVNVFDDLVPQVRDNAADLALPLLNFVQPGQRQVVSSCLSNSFAFGGNNAAIVLTKWC